MKHPVKRMLSFMLVLVMCLSLLSGLTFAASVDYKTGDPGDGFTNVILNWGTRGTTATFLSPNALTFYEDNDVTYSGLSALDGAASVGSVPGSELYQTLQSLREAAPTNPDFEITLKRNFLNQYCVQAAYEPAATVFEPEARAVFGWLKQPDADLDNPPSFAAVREELYGRFMDTPLSAMQPETIPAPQAVILQAADATDAFAAAAGR
jgi:hypothetical protein